MFFQKQLLANYNQFYADYFKNPESEIKNIQLIYYLLKILVNSVDVIIQGHRETFDTFQKFVFKHYRW